MPVKSLLLTTLLLLLLFAGLAFRGRPDKSDGPVTFEFWHGMGSQQGGIVNDLADQFNDSQDKYRVVPIYQGNYNSLSQKLIASLYARRNPAISQMYPGSITRFYKYGFLKPVQEFMGEDPAFGPEELQDYFDVMIEENILRHPKTNEKELVTLPFNKSVYVLYANQTLMEELGWHEPPKTWDEFAQLASDMTLIPEGASTPTRYGFAARPYIEDFTVQALSAGTQLYDEEKNEILVDSPAAAEALAFLHDLTSGGQGRSQLGYVDSDYLNGPFGSGKIGMFIASTASFRYNDMAVGNAFIWMAYRVPSRDEQTVGKTLMQGTNVGIFNNRPEQELQGAWEFMKFITTPEATAYWAMNTGYMPVRKSTRELPEFQQYLQDDPRYANALATLDYAAFEPRRMFWESVRDAVTRETESVLLGRKSVQQALASARKAIEDVRGRSGEE